MKKHKLSKLFPPMSQSEIRELAADIKTNGQRWPIIRHEGAILDGVQRERACKLARVPPHYAEFREHSADIWRNGALAYVVSENLMRRHLTPEKQRQLHRELVPLVKKHIEDELKKAKQAEKNNCASLHKKSRGRPKGSGIKDKAVKQVAKMTGSSRRTVYANIRKKKAVVQSRNGSKQVKKKSSQPLTLDDKLEKLIELARINDGAFKTRIDDYVVTAVYSPDRKKEVPAIKTLVVENCGKS